MRTISKYLTMEPSDFPIIIGGGAFGVVKTGLTHPFNEFVAKFLKDKILCGKAKKEFLIHKSVWSAYDSYVSFANDEFFVGVVPKPIHFTENDGGCSVVSERLISAKGKGDFSVHIIINDALSPHLLGTLIKTPSGEPRGYFYGPKQLVEEFDVNVSYLTYNIGVLDAICIFGSRQIPIDVEYILIRRNDGTIGVGMIDYGMFEEICEYTPDIAVKIAKSQEINLYYYPEMANLDDNERVKCRDSYKLGFSMAYNFFKTQNEKYQILFDTLNELYDIL